MINSDMIKQGAAGTRLVCRVARILTSALLATFLEIADAVPGNAVSDGQWAGYGRTDDQTHFSPLADINASNVSQLGLAWWVDIPGVAFGPSVPLEVDGTLYFATGYSIVRAVDAVTGKQLWSTIPA